MMTKIYRKDSQFDFGMFKGYELGIVYVFDPSYIDWCINNINGFCVIDLDELQKYSVVNPEVDVRIKMVGEPSLIEGIDIFETFEELVENLEIGNNKYEFSQKTIDKNSINAALIDDFEHNSNMDYSDEWNNSTHCFVDDDPSVCEDIREWEQEFARDNGYFPDGTGWRPDSI